MRSEVKAIAADRLFVMAASFYLYQMMCCCVFVADDLWTRRWTALRDGSHKNIPAILCAMNFGNAQQLFM
jgi:hypothetical protein